MPSDAKSSLTTTIAALLDAAAHRTPAEISALCTTLLREHPEFLKQLARKFPRLPVSQQQALVELVQRVQVHAFLPLLQHLSRRPDIPLCIRALAIVGEEALGGTVDAPYRDALCQAADTLTKLRPAGAAALTASGDLQPAWRETVLNLPLALACDLARELSTDHPATALAVLQVLRPIVDMRDCQTLVESLVNIPLPDSAALLQEMLAETTNKPLQKAIKRALHRLKAQGVTFADPSQQTRTARVGTVTHRLEKCLVSHIDGRGDRVVWLIRTKPFGGYNVAYLIINYGTGIKDALRLQVSKRELPELLAKAQEHLTLIELDPLYGQYHVALAYQMNRETGTPVPEEFFLLRDIVGEPPTTFEKPLIYAALSEADLQEAAAYGDRVDALLDVPEFAGWTLPEPVVQKYGDQLREIEESPIVVSQARQQERIDAVYARALEEVLDERTRRLLRLQLEEMAYYLLQTGRRRDALRAVAAAQSLATDDPQRLRRHPFIKALLERSLEAAKERPSSPIILPFASRSGEGERKLIV